jgi:hypothetical protein
MCRVLIRKKALLFGKGSKKFCSLGVRVAAPCTPREQKFFGSFFQKRTALPFAAAKP